MRTIIIKQKIFYLCGGMGLFGKERFDEANDWRIYFKDEFKSVTDGKVQCCNPNDHFNFLNTHEYSSQLEIMELDLYKVRNSDAVIVNFNDPKSIRSACEMTVAHELRIPIIGLCENVEMDNLHPWLKGMCNRIFKNREELVLYILKHYVNDD